MGLKLEVPAEHETPSDIECWEDNWVPYCVFTKLSTQWNIGKAGAIGIRYEAIHAVLVMDGIKKTDRSQAFNDLTVMEREALQLFKAS